MLNKNNKLNNDDLENISGGSTRYGHYHVRCYDCEHDAGKDYHELSSQTFVLYEQAERLKNQHAAETSHTNIEIKNSLVSA